MSITATLKEAKLTTYNGLPVVVGKIYGDVQQRFEDGYEVTTTVIRSFDAEAQTVTTRNSTYKVEPWPNPMRCPLCDGVFSHADAGNLNGPDQAARALLLMRDDLPEDGPIDPTQEK